MEFHSTGATVCGDPSAPFGVKSCQIFLNGASAGSLEVEILCDEEDAEEIAERLALRIPGSPELLGRASSRYAGKTLMLVCRSEALRLAAKPPEQVILHWDHQDIGLVSCELAKCVPIEVFHTLQDPSRYCAEPRKVHRGRIKIVGEAYYTLAFAAALLLAAGLAGEAFASANRASHSVDWLTIGLCSVFFGFFCLHTWRHLPHREVWIEFARERVSVYDRMWLPGIFIGRKGKHRSFREFSHVRVVQSDVAVGGKKPCRSVWLVSLEGPVHYASNTGIVQRKGGLDLVEMDAHHAALEYAARIATHLDVRILDTGRSWS